jgi:hypothetical protein
MAGYSYTSAANGHDFYLMRTDGAGDEWWSRTYHNSGDDVCYSIIECSDGGFALAGFTGATDRDFWLVRTDEDGNVLWDKTYGDVGDEDNGFSVAQCWDDGFIIAGETDGWHSSIDYYLIRTDENGNTLWEQAYGTNGDDQGRVVVVCADGSYAIVGFTEDSGSWDAMLMRIPATITSTPSTMPLGFSDLIPIIIIVVVVIVIAGIGILLWRRRRTPELEA